MANIEVRKVIDPKDLNKAFEIRKSVFVDEQGVALEDEWDEFEEHAVHYLGYLNDAPAGAARWRQTEKGVKLERFAVLKSFRSYGLGAALVKKVVQDVEEAHPDKTSYLHAQVNVVELYEKFGFKKIGSPFDECGIMHYHMEKPPKRN